MRTRKRSVGWLLVLALAMPLTLVAKTDTSKKKKPKNKKQDVEAIGDRDVGKGMNFYSLR